MGLSPTCSYSITWTMSSLLPLPMISGATTDYCNDYFQLIHCMFVFCFILCFSFSHTQQILSSLSLLHLPSLRNQGKLLNYRLVKDSYGMYVIQGDLHVVKQTTLILKASFSCTYLTFHNCAMMKVALCSFGIGGLSSN